MSSSTLAKSINDAATVPSGTVKEAERVELLQACENLKRSLETPLESTLQIIFGVRYINVDPLETTSVSPDISC